MIHSSFLPHTIKSDIRSNPHPFDVFNLRSWESVIKQSNKKRKPCFIILICTRSSVKCFG
jgi:hypothetical protein